MHLSSHVQSSSDLLEYLYGLSAHRTAMIVWAREGMPPSAEAAAAAFGPGMPPDPHAGSSTATAAADTYGYGAGSPRLRSVSGAGIDTAGATGGAGTAGPAVPVHCPYAKALRFASALTDDINHHYDEALKSLREAGALDKDKRAGWPSAASAQARSEKETELRRALDGARMWLHYACDQVSLLVRLTDASAGGGSLAFLFLSREVAPRLADNLGYYLDNLVRPEKRKALAFLSPEERARIGFKPRDLLLDVMAAYTNLAAADTPLPLAAGQRAAGGAGAGGAASDAGAPIFRFASFIAGDERSFRLDNWREAGGIMATAALDPAFALAHPHVSEVLSRWAQLLQRVSSASTAKGREEEDMGDLPDEVADGIMGTLLECPVRLPGSRQVMDRGHIERYLLDEERDPYNRSHLTPEMLIPMPHMTAALRQWKRARLAKDAAGEEEALELVRQLKESEGEEEHKKKKEERQKKKEQEAKAEAAETATAAAPAAAAAQPGPPPRAAAGASAAAPPDDEEWELQQALALSMHVSPVGAATATGSGEAARAFAAPAPAVAPRPRPAEEAADLEQAMLEEAIRLSMQQ